MPHLIDCVNAYCTEGEIVEAMAASTAATRSARYSSAHKHDIRCRTDIELYRMRRTLSQVMRKLEEALHLSRRRDEILNERATATHRRR